MAIKIVDWLSIDLVLIGSELISTEDEWRAFVKQVGAGSEIEYGSTLIPKSDGDVGTVKQVRMKKERITIQSTGERTIVKQEYPVWERFVEIATVAIQNSEKTSTQAHGFNVALVCDQDSKATAHEYLAHKVFAPPSMDSWSIAGGKAEYRFYDEVKRIWNVEIAPRYELEDTSKVYFHFNLHKTGAHDIGTLAEQVTLVRTKAQEYVEVVDREVR